MEKGSQPSIWNKYNTIGIANEAFARGEQRRRTEELDEALSYSDRTEILTAHVSDMKENMVYDLQSFLCDKYGLYIDKMGADITEKKIAVMFFDPHETVTDDTNVVPVNYSTSVVSFNIYEHLTNRERHVRSEPNKIGSVILFAMSAAMPGEPALEIGAHDLRWGDNCVYGAIAKDGMFKWFEMVYYGEERVLSEVRRRDSTEDSGETVESRVVGMGVRSKGLKEIDPNSNVATELTMELDKFLESRKAQG